MIKSVTIRWFQSHRKTRLRLHPRVNALVGDSDAGKSAVVRALYWWATNRPTGTAFMQRGGDTVAVEVETSDGHAIIRCREPGANGYSMDGQRYVALGTDVPEPVRAAIRMGPGNWQRQHDSPFLLSSDYSPGDVARRLNEVAQLDAIDRTLANLAAAVRSTAQEETRQVEAVRAAREAVAACGDVAAMERAVAVAEHAQVVYTYLTQKQAEMQAARVAFHAARREAAITKARQNTSNAKERVALWQAAAKQEQAVRKLEAGLRRIEDAADDVRQAQITLVAAERIHREVARAWKRVRPKTCPTCGQAWPKNGR